MLKAVKLIPVPSPNGTNKAQLYFKVQDMNLGDRRAFNIAEDEADPEGTNSARPVQGAASALKAMHKVTGGIENNYFPNDPAEDEDGALSAEQIDAICDHCQDALGFSPEMVERLRGQLSAKQAQDDEDEPPAFRGQPLRGGAMRAMDSRVGGFKDRWPAAARISGNDMTQRRDRVPPQQSLAMDRSGKAGRNAGGKSFEQRWGAITNRIGHCY